MKLTDNIYIIALLAKSGLTERAVEGIISDIVSFKVLGTTLGTYKTKDLLVEFTLKGSPECILNLDNCISFTKPKVVIEIKRELIPELLLGEICRIDLKSKLLIQSILKTTFNISFSESMIYLFNSLYTEEEELYLKAKVTVYAREYFTRKRLEILMKLFDGVAPPTIDTLEILTTIAEIGEIVSIEPMEIN